jgi:hypothetical protein
MFCFEGMAERCFRGGFVNARNATRFGPEKSPKRQKPQCIEKLDRVVKGGKMELMPKEIRGLLQASRPPTGSIRSSCKAIADRQTCPAVKIGQ